MTRIVPAQPEELSNTKRCLVMMMAFVWLGVENVWKFSEANYGIVRPG